MHSEPVPAAPGLFRAIFAVVVLVLLLAVAWTGWIVIRYWDRVGV